MTFSRTNQRFQTLLPMISYVESNLSKSSLPRLELTVQPTDGLDKGPADFARADATGGIKRVSLRPFLCVSLSQLLTNRGWENTFYFTVRTSGHFRI